jgi:hypothetical protein
LKEYKVNDGSPFYVKKGHQKESHRMVGSQVPVALLEIKQLNLILN